MRLLLVTYEFPPRGGPGVQRPLKLAKYLGIAGWDLTVLTVDDPPTAIVDEGLLGEVPPAVNVARAWSLEPTRLVQLLRRLRGDRASVVGGQGFSGAPSGLVSLVQSLFVPDEKRYWKPWAVRAGMRAHADASFDVVVSTGPPHTAHLVAGTIARRTGVAHVIDFRDPWFGGLAKRYATPLHKAWNRRLEEGAIARAAAVVTVTDEIARMYRQRYPGSRLFVIPNGFDPDDLPDEPHAPHDGLVFAYTGTFGGARQPDTFLAGAARAESLEPGFANDVHIVAAGPGPEFVEAARRAGVRSTVTALGYVSHDRSLKTLAGADVAVLILSSGEESRVSLSGKVFEYVGMHKPVLAVVGEGAAHEFVSGLTGGRAVPYDDPSAVADAMLDIYAAWKADRLIGPGEDETARFSRVEQARAYMALLEEVVTDARGA